ncbi:PGF-CTERM sorting domain-containing protein [Halovenus sp. WSH3]|uniref:PGF-CTERM sorting domain-containing protein n=1 Tax=Halovenus carboxidivorans TaxID=2692199 RepID=A0A6B0T427_9EURY|nr:PGF-CTERM sorting domain-containing protein [Halovenus carboxidivorans]MXR50032.1 PGF-CTERM sorting domain-containing protein [Halovenus carboxidivorans]
MRNPSRPVAGVLALPLVCCVAVGYAAAAGIAGDTSAPAELRSDSIDTAQENITAFPVAGGANGTVPIKVEMYGIETVTVTYGQLGGGQHVRFDVTLRDANNDGIGTVTFDPVEFGAPNDGFTNNDTTDIVNTSAEYATGLDEVGLANGTYDVYVSTGETPHYNSEVADSAQSVIEDEYLTNGTYERVELVAAAAPEFTITETDLSATTVTVSESVNLTTTVRNSGGSAAEYTVTFTSDGEEIGTETATVEPGSTEVLAYEHSFESAGTYEVAANGMQIGEVAVQADGQSDGGSNGGENGESDDGTDEDSSDGSGPGFGVFVALLALSGAAVVAKRRG